MASITRFLFPLLGLSLLAAGCDDHVVAEVERSLPLSADTERLLLDNAAGDLVIEGEDRDDIFVEIEVYGPSREDERTHRRVADDLKIRIDEVDETTRRLVAELGPAPEGYSIDVTVHMPRDLALELHDGSGDIVVDGVGSLELVDGSGDLAVFDIAGDVRIDDDSGDIAVAGVGGDLRLTDESGDIGIADCDGDVDIIDGSGDMGLVDIAGTVTIEDGSGDIGVVDAGHVDIVRDDSGDVGIS